MKYIMIKNIMNFGNNDNKNDNENQNIVSYVHRLFDRGIVGNKIVFHIIINNQKTRKRNEITFQYQDKNKKIICKRSILSCGTN